MLKIIHGADFHLDSPFAGLTPEKAAARRAEQRQLLCRLGELAGEKKADLVLLAGDLFDSSQIYRETALALADELSKFPCPVFIAPGNHDCMEARSPYRTVNWPRQVHIFSSDRMEGVTLDRLNCTVWGRAFVSPHQAVSPLHGFQAPRQDGRLQLMVLHGDVADASDYGPITDSDIAASGLDYLALGHIHKFSGFRRSGATTWAYSGCPEGRGFDETGEKGVVYAELEPGRVRGELIPLCARRYEILPVDVTGKDPLSAIRAALPSRTQADIYRIILSGECEKPDLAALEQALSDQFYGLSLRDGTSLPRSLWDRRGENSLTGIFLQLMWEKCQADPQNITLQQAARFGLAALEHGEDPYL